MRFPLTRDAIAAAFRGCCCWSKRDVELETAEEKEQWLDNVEAPDDKIFVELEIAEEEEQQIKTEDEKLQDRTPDETLRDRTLAEIDELKRIEAEKIFKGDDWRELTDGYEHKYYELNDDGMRDKDYGMREGDELTEFVKMDKPRECSYSSKANYDGYVEETSKTDYDGEVETKIIKASLRRYNPFRKPGAECNGITPRQLRAVMAMITRRCEAEEWRDFNGKLLTPDSVTLYDVDRYIIKPFTVEKQTSFVEALPSTAGPQPPRFFISHWWGETVTDFLNCLEQAIRDFRVNRNDNDESRGGGMTEDTPVWICAYANNQWLLSGDITADPKESGFTKAMKVAKGRTITILDKKGIVFSRIWCIFELYLTLVDSQVRKAGESSKDRLWAVYTAHSHTYKHPEMDVEEERKALGIISGGATTDRGNPFNISAREAEFPYDLIEKSLSIQVEVAEASVEDDRRHILNSIVGRSIEDIDDEPLTAHDNYVQLNNSLRGTFASSTASLRGAVEKDDKRWKMMIKALSNGTTKGEMTFNFSWDGPFEGFSAARATQMVAHLPLTIDVLSIWGAKYSSDFWDALIEQVKQFHNLNKLDICETSVGDDKGGQEVGLRLAEMMSTNTTIKRLELDDTDLIGADNVEQWGDALMKNNTLTELMLRVGGYDDDGDEIEDGDEFVDKLKTKTENRALKLEFV